MPIYEYHCSKCGDFETMQRMSDKPLTTCPTCRRKVTKLISSTTFHLKGSGWYITDYARKGEAGGGKPEKGEKGEKGEKKGDDKKSDGASPTTASDSSASDASPSASDSSSSEPAPKTKTSDKGGKKSSKAAVA